jgi:hypothetical protein
VDQRYALVVYRDEGDAYVTRVFDFVADLEAFRLNLSAQSADGGGDEPEAMDQALQAARDLAWRTEGAARIAFLVADAPPHAPGGPATMRAIRDLRSRGVALYPVAASGVSPDAEVILRTAALMTSSQYLFLTDDSGLGNPHAEPHIPCYAVEHLNDVMVRAIASELTGGRIRPNPDGIIRTVGNAVDGVCLPPGEPTPEAQQ